MIKKFLQWLWDNFDLASDILSVISASILIIRYFWVEPKASIPDLLVGILGILLILAISGFVEKRNRLTRVENLVKSNSKLLNDKVINRIKAEEFFQKEQKLNEDYFVSADKIFITGITLGKTIRQFTSILSSRLQTGAEIRIIILAPEKEVIKQLELRSFGKVDEGYYKSRIKSTTDLIKITGDVHDVKGTLTVGLLPYVPSFGITMIDPHLNQGTANIEIYHHHSSDAMPTFSLSKSNDQFWFDFFNKQFELMWEKTSQKILVKESSKNKASR